MTDFPNLDPPGAEPKEDFAVGLLLEGDDVVDAATEKINASSQSDSCNMMPSQLLSTSSSAGDVLKADIPFLPMKTGADVINLFHRKKHASGDVDEVFSDKIRFKYSEKKAAEAVKHFMFGKNVHRRADCVDAASSPGDVTDSPTGISSKSSHSRPQLHHCTSVEDEFRYFMEYKQRGCFVIFNVEKFDLYNKYYPYEEPLKYRAGSDKDAFNLENAAIQLGFEHVRIIENPTRLEIKQWVYAISQADHSDYDCFACAILTHGGNGDILYARDDKLKLTDFTRPFCADVCPTLAGKPKLFFIQACRGMKLDHGKKILPKAGKFDAVDGPTPIVDGSSEERATKQITIPNEADFLIANSTVPDYYAWRNGSNGSWFIQSLCAVFARYGLQMELMQMMTRVNRMVAFQFKSCSNNEDYDQKKQIPSIATRLTAEMYFTPKEAQINSALRASCSPPPSSSIGYERPRSEAFYGNENVAKKHFYVSGDYNVTPGLTKPETAFFPSPKNVSLPDIYVTKAPPGSPYKTCPRSQFPGSFEHRDPMSISIPKHFTVRKLSDNEAYSQSLNSPGIHPSATIAVAMNLQVSSNPNTPRMNRHRCSLPVNRRHEAAATDEEVVAKTMRQTNI